jgi:hypothetical protein
MGPVTLQLNEPVFAIPAAIDSNGPPAPLRDRPRSTFLTLVLSLAVHVNGVLAPVRTRAVGDVTATVGA